MSKTLSRISALEEISNWTTSDVLSLLRKNGLNDCCKAVQKRQVDGDELLHLTEGKLALWKSDLTRPLTWSLWNFVEELKKTPEKYVTETNRLESQSVEAMSDSGSWGTDFEDDVDGDEANEAASDDPPLAANSNSSNLKINSTNSEGNGIDEFCLKSSEFRNSLMLFRENEKMTVQHRENLQGLVENEKRSCTATNDTTASTYTNCKIDVERDVDESTYANCASSELRLVAPKNVSNLHGKYEKSLAEQLKEQLKLINARKPTIGPKPEVPSARQEKMVTKQPQKSFLHDAVPVRQQQRQQNLSSKMKHVSRVSETDKVQSIERSQDDLPRPPPVTIRNFDLVANLPTRTEESEDEYETFDEQIIEQNQRLSMTRVDSKQSLNNARQNSIESIYKTPSTTSQEKQDEEYEIYESITETPEDNSYYLEPMEHRKTIQQQAPPPLPAKPSNASMSPSPTPNRSVAGPEKTAERSPDKKSATLPHSGSGTSLSAELRATRPLPPPPGKQSYMDSPWFHNLTREQATALIKDRAYGNAQDGYFLLRPSTSHPNNPLILVLWFKDRVYNVPVRKRPDNRYALGSAKANEQSFASAEEIVKFYSREELVLHTGGVQSGSTKLTDTPPK